MRRGSPAPRIGFSAPARGGGPLPALTAQLLRACGAVPARLTPASTVAPDTLDGLVLTGGPDISASLHEGAQLAPTSCGALGLSRRRRAMSRLGAWVVAGVRRGRTPGAPDPERDDAELRWLGAALQRRRPVLGICRGAQLLNVYLGGNLYRDIGAMYPAQRAPSSLLPVKEVEVRAGSLLERVLGRRKLRVNALHHQSIARVGDGLRVSAVEPNRLVQAVELAGEGFVIGVQWHPEILAPFQRAQRGLFSSLVESARGAMLGRESGGCVA